MKRYSIFLCVLCVSALAQAHPYPAKAIRFVVPYPAGGPLDTVARLLGQKVSENVRQPVIVENKAGEADKYARVIKASGAKAD